MFDERDLRPAPEVEDRPLPPEPPMRPEGPPPPPPLERPFPPMPPREPPFPCGPRPPHGPHGPHGHFGHRPPPPPPVRRNVMVSELYAHLDTSGKILALLRELGHMGRVGPDGRGGQDRVLTLLDALGTMTQRELTQRLAIQPGSASELISKLEAAGLLTRTPGQQDRRTVDLALTDRGRARASELRERRSDPLSALTEEERGTLLTLLEKLAAPEPETEE